MYLATPKGGLKSRHRDGGDAMKYWDNGTHFQTIFLDGNCIVAPILYTANATEVVV